MLQMLLGLRVNVAIAFFGAFAILVMIKLTSLLPAKYYFSFSKLYAGSSEPFIVDPPSVTAARLCELMAKHNLTGDDIGRSVDCNAKFSDGGQTYRYGAALFKKDEVDTIYSRALALDVQIRQALSASGARPVITPLNESELDQIIASSKSISSIYRQMLQYYERQIENHFDSAIGNGVEKVYADIKGVDDRVSSPTSFEASGPKLRALSSVEIAAAKGAHQSFLDAAANKNLGELAKPITKTSVDQIIEGAYSTSAIARGVTQHYTGSIKESTASILHDKFADAGIKPIEQTEAKAVIFKELVKDGLANYIVATAVRLLPVLVFGIVLGFFFGRQELFSTSFAGAVAAFLLTWPIMLMWDRVVQSSWHEQKEMFLLFYGVYIVSFFLTARVGALIGIRMSEGAPQSVQSVMADGREGIAALKGTSWAELVGNIVISIAANGVVAAWNVIIPANASG